jgi:hypothetical protein
LFAYHFGWPPDVVDGLTVEDFYILTGWLERHEEQNRKQDNENEE